MDNPGQRTALESLAEAVSRGEDPAQAIRNAGMNIPESVTRIVSAAAGMNRPELLYRSMAAIAVRRSSMVNRLRMVTLYHVAVAVIAIGVLCLQNVTLLHPGNLLAPLNIPGLTWLFNVISSVTTHPAAAWTLLLVTLGLAAVLFGWGGERAPARKLFQRLPLVRELFQLEGLAGFFDILSILLGAGVPLPDAVHAAGEAVGGATTSTAAAQAARALRAGEPPAAALANIQLIPRHAKGLLVTAMRRGALHDVCRDLSRFYEHERCELVPVALQIYQLVLAVFAGALTGIAALNLFRILLGINGSPLVTGGM